MILGDALAFAGGRHIGTLVTIGRDGRPQLSVIAYALGDGVARISVTETRVKTRNLRRDTRASLFVAGDSPWAWVVLEGEAELTPAAADPQDDVVSELADLYRAVQGAHPDWDDFRRAMVADQRLVVRLRVGRAYGITG